MYLFLRITQEQSSMEKKAVKKKTYSRGSGVPHPVDVNVGKRIKMRRCMIGLSQEKLAAEIGLTFQQIQKYERAANRVSASKLYDFSKALGVPVNYFYQGMESTDNAAQNNGLSDNDQSTFDHDETDDKMSSKETYDLLREYYSIDNPQKRRDLFNIIKTFAENMRED
jgi:transcriptional regulator with XRE-family HTH domain